MELGSRVMVLHSPYSQVKRGEVGDIVARIRQRSPREILVVHFRDGKTWEFYPGELTVLCGSDAPATGEKETDGVQD